MKELNFRRQQHQSAEHAYQYERARAARQDGLARQIQQAPNAALAKKLGSAAAKTSTRSSDVRLMWQLLKARLSQDQQFKDDLQATGQSYILHSVPGPDTFWASGLAPGVWPSADRPMKGDNTFGLLLMKLRDVANGTPYTFDLADFLPLTTDEEPPAAPIPAPTSPGDSSEPDGEQATRIRRAPSPSGQSANEEVDNTGVEREPGAAPAEGVQQLLKGEGGKLTAADIPGLLGHDQQLLRPWAHADLRRALKVDPLFAHMTQYLKDGRIMPTWSKRVANWINKDSGQFFLHDDLLYRWDEFKEGKDIRYRITLALPYTFRLPIIDQFHQTVWGAHQGPAAMFGRLRQRYWWDRMMADIQQFVAACPQCSTMKKGEVLQIKLQPIRAVSPWYMIAMDFFTPYINSPTQLGNKHILVIQDYFTKWVIAEPTKDQTADTVLNILMEKVITVYGLPVVILTDNGPHFRASKFEKALRQAGIAHSCAMPYHQQTNGMVERWNRTLLSMLRPLLHDKPDRWDELLQPAVFAYRTTPHSSTGFTPFKLMYGREARLIGDAHFSNQVPDHGEDQSSYIQRLTNTMRATYETAKVRIDNAQAAYKAQHDKKSKTRTFNPGTLVLYYDPVNHSKIKPSKFHPYFEFLYLVI